MVGSLLTSEVRSLALFYDETLLKECYIVVVEKGMWPMTLIYS